MYHVKTPDSTNSRNRSLIFSIALLALTTLFTSTTVQADGHAARVFEAVKGNLYRFSKGSTTGIVLVTKAGVIVGDPMDNQTALWLRSELQRRFSQKVRYVFYSHSGDNRADGGDVFVKDGATIIAHENSLKYLGADAGEARPTVVFTDRVSLVLDDQRVDLVYPGPSLRDDIIFAHFVNEEAVYTSDLVSVERLPGADMSTAAFPEWFASIDRMNRTEFIYLLDGHGGVGIQDDAIQHSYYLRELHNRVGSAIASDASVADAIQSIPMTRYKNWANFENQVEVNVTDMYKNLSSK